MRVIDVAGRMRQIPPRERRRFTWAGVLAVLAVALLAWAAINGVRASAAAPDEWPQVCRVVQPEDLDR
jgi:type II secretory pathway component PulM